MLQVNNNIILTHSTVNECGRLLPTCMHGGTVTMNFAQAEISSLGS